ncbi:MAG TPA: hypothetical protein VLH84_02660 [Patescibacteria group bacterium]|nr:hypothetical protein [Patescibacteria group bacterium]
MSFESDEFRSLLDALRAVDAAKTGARDAADAARRDAQQASRARAEEFRRKGDATLVLASSIGALATDRNIPKDIVVGHWVKKWWQFREPEFFGELYGWRLDEVFFGQESTRIGMGPDAEPEYEYTPAHYSGILLTAAGRLHQFDRPYSSRYPSTVGGLTVAASSSAIGYFEYDEHWSYPSARYDTALAKFVIAHELG